MKPKTMSLVIILLHATSLASRTCNEDELGITYEILLMLKTVDWIRVGFFGVLVHDTGYAYYSPWPFKFNHMNLDIFRNIVHRC
jgi:hypothetical protein